ncbi:hypothetical protein LAWI1_G008367 [Lachnellula willkommii]|uniref:Uncharacterized protein n=1 Tax=Lachnellula willkommii TaxID=215461 RepID=A0A559M377_9HELO|nr:hypothetical protein LAWI1_G008367 [Lachnellula willkommii]
MTLKETNINAAPPGQTYPTPSTSLTPISCSSPESQHRAPQIPTTQTPAQQFRLELSDYWANEYKTKVNKKPMFHYKKVEFGLEDDEVVVTALLNGSTWVPQWEFRTILKGDGKGAIKDHLTDTCADERDAADVFGLMEWDLTQTAVRP